MEEEIFAVLIHFIQLIFKLLSTIKKEKKRNINLEDDNRKFLESNPLFLTLSVIDKSKNFYLQDCLLLSNGAFPLKFMVDLPSFQLGFLLLIAQLKFFCPPYVSESSRGLFSFSLNSLSFSHYSFCWSFFIFRCYKYVCDRGKIVML